MEISTQLSHSSTTGMGWGDIQLPIKVTGIEGLWYRPAYNWEAEIIFLLLFWWHNIYKDRRDGLFF